MVFILVFGICVSVELQRFFHKKREEAKFFKKKFVVERTFCQLFSKKNMFYSRKKVEKPLVGNKKVTTFAAALREKLSSREVEIN